MTIDSGLLLDTCVLLIAARNESLRREVTTAIDDASSNGRLFISPVSAWEFGLLMRSGRLKSVYSAIEFFEELVGRSACQVCDLTPAILANSSFLPNFDHRDPADCILIATARAYQFAIVTRDQTILDYGSEGYVGTLAC